VRERPLDELYFESALLRDLRAPGRMAEGCEGCAFGPHCGGGLRCLAHAVRGEVFTTDPGCFRQPD
jgi:MoaA/NifB/PqqE/SkfB family radical SAM enzyme